MFAFGASKTESFASYDFGAQETTFHRDVKIFNFRVFDQSSLVRVNLVFSGTVSSSSSTIPSISASSRSKIK